MKEILNIPRGEYGEKAVRKGTFKVSGMVLGKWDVMDHVLRILRGLNALKEITFPLPDFSG